MSTSVENDGDLAKTSAAQPMEKSGMSTAEVVVIAIVVLGVAALVAYQLFGCSGCYADFKVI